MMTLTHLPIKELLEESQNQDYARIKIAAIAEFPTRFGNFHIVSFWNHADNKEHAAIVRGDVTHAENVTVRLHSECLTGDAFGSLRCDCRDQLETALRTIGELANLSLRR